MKEKALRVTDDLPRLIAILPPAVKLRLDSLSHPLEELLEVVLDLGRIPEARFPKAFYPLGEDFVKQEDLDFVVERVGNFGKDNRAGIERTLHRISAIRNRPGRVVGLTCRVGRAVYGTIHIIRDLILTGSSLLLLGKPGVGKTTMLREVARVLADEMQKMVIVVDTSNEIAGDGDIPHPGIGKARRMQVNSPEMQHAVMIEAVENHMPEVIIVDEIGTCDDAYAARTIAERGVQLVATAHGNTLDNLLMNPTLCDLLGGIQAVTLSDEEARKRGTQKTVLERKAPPTFDILVEIQDWDTLIVHKDVAKTVDLFLRDLPPQPEIRRRSPLGDLEILQESNLDELQKLAARNKELFYPPSPLAILTDRVKIYPYGVSKNRIQRAAEELGVFVQLVRNPEESEAVLVLKAQEKRMAAKLRELAYHNKKIAVIRSNTIRQIELFLISYFQLTELPKKNYQKEA